MDNLRIVEAVAEVLGDVSAAAVEVKQPVTATAEVENRIVTAEASAEELIVTAEASIENMTVEAEAEVVTRIRTGDYPTYAGPHEVTPKAAEAQVLETARKVVLQDITVHEIPYWETSNQSGMTAFIASEV